MIMSRGFGLSRDTTRGLGDLNRWRHKPFDGLVFAGDWARVIFRLYPELHPLGTVSDTLVIACDAAIRNRWLVSESTVVKKFSRPKATTMR